MQFGARYALQEIGDEAVPLSTRLQDGAALDFFPHLEGG